MSLRAWITIAVACAVGLAVGITSIVTFVAADHTLRRQVDESLQQRAAQLADVHLGLEVDVGNDTTAGFLQAIVFPGQDGAAPAGLDFPLRAVANRVAAGSPSEAYFDQTVGGFHLRLYARHLPTGGALVIGRTVDDIDAAVTRMRALAIGAGAAGVGLAALLGWLVGRVALHPLSRVTAAVETASTTRDLTHRVQERRRDELGRLARSVNGLLGAIDESQRARQQLVADASHELRSPLASLRTNVEVLATTEDLPESDRAPLVRDVLAQLQELTTLVDDLVALARERPTTAVPEPVPLDEVADNAIARIRPRARAKQLTIDSRLAPCTVTGVAADLEHAVTNLLDNAVKWSPPGEAVEVTLTADGVLTVRDHGPGISPVDQPHVFDRFYRAPSARSLPGSGLGLAIVHKVAGEHDGSVRAEPAPGGGALLRLALPPS